MTTRVDGTEERCLTRRGLEAVGCDPPEAGEWTVPSTCDSVVKEWITCIEQDLTQCVCESSGEVNCEGSFKANEGPALCVEEIEAVNACME